MQQRIEAPKPGPRPRPSTSELRVQSGPSVKQRMQCVYKALERTGGLQLNHGDVVGIGTVSKATAKARHELLNPNVDPLTGAVHKPFNGPLFEAGGNQDSALVLKVRGATLLAVFDGVGAEARGQLAAELARDELVEVASNYAGIFLSKAFLGKALRAMRLRINEQLFDGLGDTTATVVIVGDPDTSGRRRVMTIGAGDSLAFALTHEGKRIFQLNPDQSDMKMEVGADGSITRTNEHGGPIFSSVRKPAKIEIREGVVGGGDSIVLTTDGITGDVPGQYPIHGQARLLHGLAAGAARDPQQLIRNALGQATKLDDRTVILFAADGATRWPSRAFPVLDDAVNREFSSGSLGEWTEGQELSVLGPEGHTF